MPPLEPFDTVKIKNGTIVGTVDRTYSGDSGEATAIEDFLIIAHVPVPQDVILNFATGGGVVPKGYVFVVAAEESQGAFLAAEDDLELLCRSFDIGDNCKSRDGSIGTIINVSDTHDIQPVWLVHDGRLVHYTDLTEQRSPTSLMKIPGDELKHADEINANDFVSQHHWLGAVDDPDELLDVVVRLEDDSYVSLQCPTDLFLPVTDFDKPIVHIPDFDDISRPHALSAFGGWSSVLAVEHPSPGAFVVTSRSTIRAGKFLSGKFNSRVAPQGRVIAVVPRSIGINWLICNPFAPLRSREVLVPNASSFVYSNPAVLSSAQELRRNEAIHVFDLSKPVALVSTMNNKSTVIGSRSDLRVGESVRFQDPVAAAAKYEGDDVGRNRFDKIDNDLAQGWDVNVFKVTSKHQICSVQWTNGTVSQTSSNDLSVFTLFGEDLWPADVVVSRAGLKMRLADQDDFSAPFVEFNEMKFFETPHDLEPERVGVVQSIDSSERIATIRWYKHPDIQIQGAGADLSHSSHLSFFGPIGDVKEDVSIFEIMTFPALHRSIGNLAIIPPPKLSKRTLQMISREQGPSFNDSDESYLVKKTRQRFRNLRHVDIKLEEHDTITELPNRANWVGEIIELKLDGNVTVRLSGAETCRDVVVDADHILGIIDLDRILGGTPAEDAEMDLASDISSAPSTIEETVEYEGGKRLDQDTDDDNWESAEEDGSDIDGDMIMRDFDVHLQNDQPQRAPHQPQARPQPPPQAQATSTATFQPTLAHLPPIPPASFAILDISPPPDQYRPATTSSSRSPTFLKRIHREQSILSSSLPPSIYIRAYESDLSLLRCLIIGPNDTPYEHAPFLIDLYLPPQFPSEPPIAHFHSWTSGLGRINPNLYEEGKICLSLLGTWPGQDAKEKWSKDSTILQLLVSLQGLVMVKEPFYNEAGFEEYADEQQKGYENESAQYSEKAYVMARGLVKHALTQPPGGLEDVLAWLYFRAPTSTASPDLEINGGGGNGNTTNNNHDGDQPSASLFQRVIDRGWSLMLASRTAREDAAHQSQLSDREPVLFDGAGREGTKKGDAFLRPLSKGAMVSLRRVLDELVSCHAATGTGEEEFGSGENTV